MKNCCKICTKNCSKIAEIAKALNAIGEQNRLRILCTLAKEDKYAYELAEKLDLTHNLVSFHLKTLMEANVVESKRNGHKKIYSIKGQYKEEILKILNLNE